MHPAIFLDRDGVIIENRSEYVRDWSQVSFLPEVLEALSSLRDKDFKFIIVTNQSAIGRGLISNETAEEINHRLVRYIKRNGGRIDGVYMCPHKPEDLCKCRKPQPGLFLQAAREHSLNLSNSWMIGDAWSDLLAGQAAGLRSVVMVRTGRGTAQLLQPQPENLKSFLVFNNLSEALNEINKLR